MPPKRLLLVEPDESSRLFLREKLQAPNLMVLTAVSGSEALAVLTGAHPPDLVVAALEMTPPTGLDLAAAAGSRTPPVPVILLSRTLTRDPDASKSAGRTGAAAILPRPVVVNDLYEVIERAGSFKLEGHERRRYPRVPVHLDLTLQPEAGGTPAPGMFHKTTTVDISLGGLSFECVFSGAGGPAEPPDAPGAALREVGREFALGLALSETRILRHPKANPSQSLLKLHCRVAHVIHDAAQGVSYVGVKFVGMTDDQRNALRDFLRENQDEVRRTLDR